MINNNVMHTGKGQAGATIQNHTPRTEPSRDLVKLHRLLIGFYRITTWSMVTKKTITRRDCCVSDKSLLSCNELRRPSLFLILCPFPLALPRPGASYFFHINRNMEAKPGSTSAVETFHGVQDSGIAEAIILHGSVEWGRAFSGAFPNAREIIRFIPGARGALSGDQTRH